MDPLCWPTPNGHSLDIYLVVPASCASWRSGTALKPLAVEFRGFSRNTRNCRNRYTRRVNPRSRGSVTRCVLRPRQAGATGLESCSVAPKAYVSRQRTASDERRIVYSYNRQFNLISFSNLPIETGWRLVDLIDCRRGDILLVLFSGCDPK